jgi:hypothetical protein
MVGSRSAAYDRGSDLTAVLAGLREAADDPKAVAEYGAAQTTQQYEQLKAVLTRGLAELEHTTTGPAPMPVSFPLRCALLSHRYYTSSWPDVTLCWC